MADPARKGGRDRTTMVSVAQAAALLGVHPNTIRTWTDAGRLPAFRINDRGDRRFRRGDVERLLAEPVRRGTNGKTVMAHGHLPSNVREGPREAEFAVLSRVAEGVGPAGSAAAICRSAMEALRSNLAVEKLAFYLAAEGERDGSMILQTHHGYASTPAPRIRFHRTTTEMAFSPDEQRLEFPMRAGGEMVGILVLEGAADGPIARLRPAFLQVVANAVASDVAAARVLARAVRESTRSLALRRVTQELTAQLDLNAVLEEIIDRTRSLFDADRAGLWLIEDAEHPFKIAASRGLDDAFLAKSASLRADSSTIGMRAIYNRSPLVVRDVDTRTDIGEMQDTYRTAGVKTACLVPLVSQDRSVGVIGLYHARDREWPDDEVALAQAFANQAAVAISNARLYRSVADQAARMRSIQDLSGRLNRLTDVQAIADAIVAEASTLAAYHDIRIYAVNWEDGFCEPIAYTDRLLGAGDFRDRLRVAVGPGSFTGQVAQLAEPMLINDALNDPRGHTIEGTNEIEESMLVVPMIFEGRSVGVIALSKLGKDQFTTDDLQTMSIFAGYAAQAFANASAYERLETQSGELARQLQSQRRLLEINERLLSTLDQREVLRTIADGLRSVVRYDNLSIYRADSHKRIMTPVLTRERHAEQVMRYIVPFGRGLMGWAVDNRTPVLANDALNDPRAMQIPGTPADPEALIIVPLIADGEVIGCMNISRVGGEAIYFSASDFELVKLFAGQASIALRNADTHHEVSARADSDALTGLGNHGAFQRSLADLLEQMHKPASGRRRPRAASGAVEPAASLLMLDLDLFKGYNDRLGHPAGDALLHAVGAAISGTARSADKVFRYGGDEFCVVLPGVDTTTAREVAERVRRAIRRLTAKEAYPVTVSVGVATVPTDAQDKDGLIGAADTALYLGKQSGGDRVVVAADVPSEMRDLRITLDQLARTALQHPDEATVGTLVHEAARLSAGSEGEAEGVRDALLTLARSLDEGDSVTRGHSDRVGSLSARMAAQLGMPEDAQRTVELAGRLHGLDAAGSGELASIRSMREVGEMIRWFRLHGDPADGPLGAQVVAVANAYDELTAVPSGPRRARGPALAEIRAERGKRFRATAVEALGKVIGARPDRGQRRRRQDAPGEAAKTA